MRVVRNRGFPALETPCSRSTDAALPGRRRQARIRRELAAIVEVTEEPLRPEDGGELRTDALDVEQHRRRRWRADLLRGKQRISLGLHRLDLLEQQFEPIEFTADLGLEMRRQGTAVARRSARRAAGVDRDAAARSPRRPEKTASPFIRLTCLTRSAISTLAIRNLLLLSLFFVQFYVLAASPISPASPRTSTSPSGSATSGRATPNPSSSTARTAGGTSSTIPRRTREPDHLHRRPRAAVPALPRFGGPGRLAQPDAPRPSGAPQGRGPRARATWSSAPATAAASGPAAPSWTSS